MVVDTGGVLDANGVVIRELKSNATIATAPNISGVKDVTGGIMHKVASCRQATDWADAVYIVGNDAAELSAAFAGKPAGTIIL